MQQFLDQKKIKSQIHVINGSVEVAPSIGLSDAIFDIVSSGGTLVSNRLQEEEIAMRSEAILLGKKDLTEDKQRIIDAWIFRIESVQVAEGKKYLLMNAPSDKLDEIIAILPGMRSPTVTPLATMGWCSVQSVVEDAQFWDIISKLKELGAEGILVLPIEKMIL